MRPRERLAVVVLEEMEGNAPHMFIGIKLLVMLGVVALTEISHARGRRGEAKPALLHAAAALVVVNLIVAYTLPH